MVWNTWKWRNDRIFNSRSLSCKNRRMEVLRNMDSYTRTSEAYQRVGADSYVKPAPPGYLDKYGCVKTQNDVALLFNKVLKDEIVKLRANLSNASIVYVDVYAAKYERISTSKDQGFEDPFATCCSYHGVDYDVYCENTGHVNGTKVFATSCPNPSEVISWDGVHYIEAANKWITDRIVNGFLSDPPVAVSRACHKQVRVSRMKKQSNSD
ncbi:GDSL esterase/lipase [Striga hermonthica]|uniref:GDSL esterase/lipase n=1 Tax=Striga hermonthica TaxID=68872 RepID=A0A9N7N739_STRHE|nr:GDSL esterase/lipase [Striga hermonthica]